MDGIRCFYSTGDRITIPAATRNVSVCVKKRLNAEDAEDSLWAQSNFHDEAARFLRAFGAQFSPHRLM
jgi:hypothetical protein